MAHDLTFAFLAGFAMATYSIFLKLASPDIHPALGATIITGVAFLANLALTVTLKASGAPVSLTKQSSLYFVIGVRLAAACADLFTLSAYSSDLKVTDEAIRHRQPQEGGPSRVDTTSARTQRRSAYLRPVWCKEPGDLSPADSSGALQRFRFELSPHNARALAHRIMQAGPFLLGRVREEDRRHLATASMFQRLARSNLTRMRLRSLATLTRWERTRSSRLVRGLVRSFLP